MSLHKSLLIFMVAICTISAMDAQTTLQRPKNPDYPGGRGSSLVNRLSATATVGSGWINGSSDWFGQVGIGEVTVSYALFRFLDLGVSTSGSLLCNQPFEDVVGGSITYNPIADDCDKAWAVGETFSVMARYFPLSELPAFAQVNGGYSLDGEAPFASLCLGWGQPVWGRFSVIGQVRYATLISPDLEFQIEPGGLRLELGVGWNL